MKFFKNKKGFTLVELVVVIAILGILAGIAIPRFMDATASARGAKIIADMRTIESAETMYYAQNGAYADMATLAPAAGTGYLAKEPVPPSGSFIIPESNVKGSTTATSYNLAADNTATPPTFTLSLTVDSGDKTLANLTTKS